MRLVPTTKEMIRAQQQGALKVIPPHTRWLELPQEQQVYTPEALEHAMRVLTRRHQVERGGRFSPSSLGECPRRVLFGYAGAPQIPPDPDQQDLMNMGSRDHLFWQMEGLSAGYLKTAELYAHDPELDLGGSLDGVLVDDSILELKTVRERVYMAVVSKDKCPKYEHLIQFEAYSYLTDMEWGSIVYQNRESGMCFEFRVKTDPRRREQMLQLVETLQGHVEVDDLPQMLHDCEMRVGYTYKSCPFRLYCPTADTVTVREAA